MKNVQIHPFAGLNLDTPPRFMKDNYVTRAENIIFNNGCFMRRGGYKLIGSSLGEKVMALFCYDPFLSSTTHLLAFTKRDSWRYDTASDSWKYITKRFYYGTVTTSGTGNRTVTHTPAASPDDDPWSTAWPDGMWYVGFGATDPNSIATWYLIASFDSATQLTLSVNGPSATGSTYVIRQCWTGGDDDYHSIGCPIYEATGEKAVVITNGLDDPQIWRGVNGATGNPDDGFCRDIDNAATGDPPVPVAKYCGAISTRVVFGYVTDDGSGNIQTQKIRFSAIGEPENWPLSPYLDLYETDDDIMGIVPLKTSIMVYKRNSVTELVENEDPDTVYTYYERKLSVGVRSVRTVVEHEGVHLFRGGNTVYLTDGINLKDIGAPINEYLNRTVNDIMEKRSFAAYFPEEKLYALFIAETGNEEPNKAYVFNLVSGEWQTWSFRHKMTAAAYHYREESEVLIQDLLLGGSYHCPDGSEPTWENLLRNRVRVIDFIRQSVKRKYVVFGDEDGNVFEYDSEHQTDGIVGSLQGAPIYSTVETIDHPMDDEQVNSVMFQKIVVGGDSILNSALQMQISPDEGTTWSPPIPFDMYGVGGYIERMMRTAIRGKRMRIRLSNRNGSLFKIESLMLGYEDAGTGVR